VANLRIISITVVNSSNITAKFSENLNEDINTTNITISAQTPGVSSPSVLIVTVSDNLLYITTQPLVPQAAYFITFQSTNQVPFNSLNGDAFILNDGITNRQLILGPLDSSNPVQIYLNNFLRNNVYNLDSPSIISSYIQGLSSVFSQSLYAIRQSKNENYLTTTIIDEFKTRGNGPYDRLNEESAYEILRVGMNPTSDPVQNITSIPSFPSYPVSLQAASYSENLPLVTVDKIGTFNQDTFTINFTKNFVIILNSVLFVYDSSLPPYNYDIPTYGYQIYNSLYDPDNSFTYELLANNQVILNRGILNDPNFSTENIAYVQVTYQYQNTGKVLDPTSLIVDTILSSGREVLPPLENTFTLMHAPIVTNNDAIGSIGSVIFTDPNEPPGSNIPHPAFLYELPFRLDYLPSQIGEYSVDYSSGNVYVYGQDNNKTGTGAYPPLATYTYRYVFKSEIDYVYDSDSFELVALPNGSLIGSSANIIFNYEEVLAQGIDYVASSHIEVLNEYIDNRLVALNTIQPLNFPVTDVFRIFNQTTGEVYSILRWTNNQIFFNYVKAPNIVSLTSERASFQNIMNETLSVGAVMTLTGGNIFKFYLNNNNIISASQDEVGSSFNSSVSFSNMNIFIQEIYFDNSSTQTQNVSRLQNIGDYEIDYVNGVVWCYVSSTQSYSVGSISYKRGYITPNNPHLISVDDIYYQLSIAGQKTKQFSYVNFTDGNILPSTFDVANEGFLNGNTQYPYQVYNNQVGTFINTIFSPGVSNYIGYIRGLYEYEDLLNNINPINFSQSSTFNGKNITVGSLVFTEYHSIQFDGTNYYVFANNSLQYLSPNITLNIQIIRLSDNAQLWDNSGMIILGNPFKLILPNINSPQLGDAIQLIYSYTINNLYRVIVDYDKGGYYIDYTYLVDEIIISYEYGDNVLDFSKSMALSPGDTYYVSYKVGALRDALLKNFGTLINIPILNSLDVSFERERYRDALIAAMSSFPQGPTISSMSNIVNTIVHTPPQIIESAFQNWSLGSDLLNPEPITTSGSFSLVPARYDNGVLMNVPGQIIKFPTVSNLRLEQGSFECWVKPNWNGIDNQSILTFTIIKNGQSVLPQNVFLGPSAYHPEFLDGYSFSVNKNSSTIGIPNKSKDGIFIYIANDPYTNINRWYVDILDGYADGYGIKNYQVSIKTDGNFYNVKSLKYIQPTSDRIFSANNSISYTISNINNVHQGITFIADYHHYIFDFGKDKNHNRFSIYKDESGYLNFRVFDKDGRNSTVDTDISSWLAGQQHHVAASWAINTKNNRDELHLFIDGQEVPNIIKYGSNVETYLHEKFRTVNPEEIVGIITSAIVSSTDLVTTLGLNNVTSSLNFSAYGIVNGGTIYIEEPGFSTSGYLIINVNGNTLTLATPMPLSMTGASFSINKTSFNVLTEIDLYPNVIISLLHSSLNGTDLKIIDGYNIVTSASINFSMKDVVPGYLIRITESGFAENYVILGVNGQNLILNSKMPASYSSASFFIYPNIEQEIPGLRALHPAYSITRNPDDTVTLTIKDKALPNDIVLIRTLGLNHRLINHKYYIWGNTANIIKTRLPSPILLSDVKITHILLDRYNIGPVNSTLIGGVFVSNNIMTDQPSISDNGRTLSVYISGTNIDYSNPVTVSIYGTNNTSSPEILIFTKNDTLSTISQFTNVNYVVVNCNPIDPTQNCVVISILEANPITVAENSTTVPVIRYSYQTVVGNSLIGSGNTVTDSNNFFSSQTIGNYLVITYPPASAGQYQITDVSSDYKSINITPALPSPITSDGVYEVLTVSTYRSGLQNGYFILENLTTPGQPYNLVQGLYQFEYYTYLTIPMNLTNLYSYVGTDFAGHNVFNGIIDELTIISEKLTDVRIGEMVGANQETITKDFNSLKALQPTANTSMLLHFDSFPFTNDSSIYTTASNQFIQSSISVNDNFGKSIVLTNKPMVIDNTGILTSKQEGTIEFWINPIYDTGNDPNYRYYFDASGIVSQQVVSINNATVQVSGRVSQVLNVKLQVGNQNVDYFAGGTIGDDMQTLYLNRALPNQQTPVVVNYIPTGTNGDRISIFKDPSGYVNFSVTASGIVYQIRTPAYWSKGTWHRLKATFKVNSGLGSDEIRFFVDGYERGNVLFGNGLLYGQNQVFGSSFTGQNTMQASIIFKDTINELFIGSDFSGTNGAYALIDNLRISNQSRPLFMPFGESLDVNYSTNTDIVLPVTPDLYTTLLLDFDTLITKNTNFATLKNSTTGLSDFTINIYDSFDILADNAVVKQVLEELINTLKPANTQVYINYF
jgi:hypothetical protein